jgi:cytochrome c nitrite reductase small subunit
MRILRALIPPKKWQLVVVVLLGVIAGLGMFIMRESNAVSYLGDDPKTCVNCHVMTTQYTTWQNSSHSNVASCNDCHVPHDNFVKKYAFKAKDGLYHATIFTMRAEPEVITMHKPGQEVVQQNCIRCHSPQVTDAKASSWIEGHYENRTDRTCWDCHREVPHGRVRSLSTVNISLDKPSEKEAQEAIVPEWIKHQMNQEKPE